jgi:hypothetical protein
MANIKGRPNTFFWQRREESLEDKHVEHDQTGSVQSFDDGGPNQRWAAGGLVGGSLQQEFYSIFQAMEDDVRGSHQSPHRVRRLKLQQDFDRKGGRHESWSVAILHGWLPMLWACIYTNNLDG